MIPSSVRALLLLSSLPGLSLGLSMSAPTILSISVPRYIMEGSEAVLTCNYRYHSQPYSVRWYKNGKEFYRLVVALAVMAPHSQFFNRFSHFYSPFPQFFTDYSYF